MIEAGITDLDFRSGAVQLSIRRHVANPSAPVERVDGAGEVATSSSLHLEIQSDYVGNFQRRHPTRNQPALAEGAQVTAGETLGFVRDGLVLYPVVAPHSGAVRKIPHADGAPIGYGATLFELEITVSR